MGYLCFGSFASLLKNATPLGKGRVVDLLVKAIGCETEVDPSDKSKLINSKIDLEYLKDIAGTVGAEKKAEKFFSENIIDELTKLKINELVELLRILIIKDDTITSLDKDNLLVNANREHLSEFLSKTFLFAATRPNCFENNPLPVITYVDNAITIANGKIFLNGDEICLPDRLIPPKKLEDNEAVYVAELLKLYAEKQKITSCCIDELPDKYRNELERHRQDYYNAEAIHRKIREIYSNDENEFNTLKDEAYDGIIDTHSMTYPNSYERLLNVLQQAVKLQEGKSLLWRLPKWIGSSEKKGVCHILVNDKRLTWVVKDE